MEENVNGVIVDYRCIKNYVDNYITSGRKHTIVIPPARIRVNNTVFYFSEVHNRYYNPSIDAHDVWFDSRLEQVLSKAGIDFRNAKYELLTPERVVVRIASKK